MENILTEIQSSVKWFESAFLKRTGQREILVRDRNQIAEKIKEEEELDKHLLDVRVFLQTVANATQQELEYHVSEIVSLALEAVFEDPYKFKLVFTPRRGRSEADLFFEKNGVRIDPMTAAGCGAVDIASFALRIALWSLRTPRTRNTIVFDEPFKYLSKDLQTKASSMVKEISQKLNLQIIIITHEEAFVEQADKVYRVTKRGPVSKVRKVR